MLYCILLWLENDRFTHMFFMGATHEEHMGKSIITLSVPSEFV